MQIMDKIISRLSDFWVVSGKVMTVISLIVIPSLLILSHYYIYQQTSSKSYFEIDPITGKPILKYRDNFDVFLMIVAYVQLIIFFFILLVYPPYPFPASVGRYFQERGYKKAVDEYEFIKKVLYIIIPLVLVFGIWSTEPIASPIVEGTVQFLPSEFLQEIKVNQKTVYDSINHDDLYVDFPALLLILVFVATVFKLVCIRVRKDFRLYYARGCFVICQGESNEVRKMSYFTMGLNSYNYYLRRLISLEIGDLKTKIYSKIASSSVEEKSKIMNSIISSFLTDKSMEANTLEPVRQLAEFTQKSITDFLTKQPFLNKLKEWTAISSVIVTMAVSLFPALLNR